MTAVEQEIGTGLVVVEARPIQMGTLQASGPSELIASATAMATPLAQLIEKRGLFATISGRKYVKCEGWTTLGAMLGITPHEVGVVEVDGVFTATVELRMVSDGRVVGRASAECGAPDELDRNGVPLWANRARYARRSMALTRATAKAFRLAFSWIMVLAGYQPTPAEEIPEHEHTEPAPAPNGSQAKAPRQGGPVVPFGKQKGMPIAALDDAELHSLKVWCEAKDAQKFEKLIAQCAEEQERRRAEAGVA